ncbi:hypothetical protein BGZ83_011097 [Gryganskiella cystojenkinii]|nr:hypothetical protein BGZ83_011097 [Gryganskiella cystojenkinii]
MPFTQPTGVAVGRSSSIVAPIVNAINSGSLNNLKGNKSKDTEKSCHVVNSWVKSATNLFTYSSKEHPHQHSLHQSLNHSNSTMNINNKNNAKKSKNETVNSEEPTTVNKHDGSIRIFTKTWRPVGVTVQSVLVFVHDVVEHCERYQPLFATFAGKGIEVQSLDLPGFGETGARADVQGVTGGYDALLKEIDSAIDRAVSAHPTKPIFLMGHGMGGALVLNYVCGLGQRITFLAGLISSSPYLKPTIAGAGSRFPSTYNRLGKWYPNIQIRFPVLSDELTRDLEQQSRHHEDGLILDTISLQCLGDMIYQGQKVLTKRWKNFPNLLPTLLLHGTDDPICSYQATQQLCHQLARLHPASLVFKTWKGGKHDPHWDLDAESVRSELVHWIRNNYRHFVKAPLEPEMVRSISIKSARVRSRRSSIAAAHREKEEEKLKKKLIKEQARKAKDSQNTDEDVKKVGNQGPSSDEREKDKIMEDRSKAQGNVEVAVGSSSSGNEMSPPEDNMPVPGTNSKDGKAKKAKEKKIKPEKLKKLSKADKKHLELEQKRQQQQNLERQQQPQQQEQQQEQQRVLSDTSQTLIPLIDNDLQEALAAAVSPSTSPSTMLILIASETTETSHGSTPGASIPADSNAPEIAPTEIEESTSGAITRKESENIQDDEEYCTMVAEDEVSTALPLKEKVFELVPTDEPIQAPAVHIEATVSIATLEPVVTETIVAEEAENASETSTRALEAVVEAQEVEANDSNEPKSEIVVGTAIENEVMIEATE